MHININMYINTGVSEILQYGQLSPCAVPVLNRFPFCFAQLRIATSQFSHLTYTKSKHLYELLQSDKFIVSVFCFHFTGRYSLWWPETAMLSKTYPAGVLEWNSFVKNVWPHAPFTIIASVSLC